MTIETQLLLMLSAFGALNGFLVSGYLFFSAKQQIAWRFLAFMLAMISIRIFKSILFYFNPEMTKWILQLGLSACFLIGPFLYFYVLANTQKLNTLVISWKVQLAVLLSIVFVVGGLFPYTSNNELWQTLIYRVINYTWLLYIGMSVYSARAVLISFCQKPIKPYRQDELLMICALLGNIVIWFAYHTSSYTSYIVGALSFSLIFLLSSVLVYFRMKPTPDKTPIKYADKHLGEDEVANSLAKLSLLMEEQKLYQNPNITMPQVAKRIGLPSPKFSQLLNEKLNKSFSLYINEWRIEQAKSVLTSQSNQKMDDLAEQCGFNSSSTFYSVFKKLTGLTPAKYREKYTPKL